MIRRIHLLFWPSVTPNGIDVPPVLNSLVALLLAACPFLATLSVVNNRPSWFVIHCGLILLASAHSIALWLSYRRGMVAGRDDIVDEMWIKRGEISFEEFIIRETWLDDDWSSAARQVRRTA